MFYRDRDLERDLDLRRFCVPSMILRIFLTSVIVIFLREQHLLVLGCFRLGDLLLLLDLLLLDLDLAIFLSSR